jgi:hypothetical protein
VQDIISLNQLTIPVMFAYEGQEAPQLVRGICREADVANIDWTLVKQDISKSKGGKDSVFQG